MRTRLFLFAATLTLIGIQSPVAWAAQDAQVTNEAAAVFESPSESAAAFDYLPAGSVLRVSRDSRNGWFKVVVPGRTPQTMGWMKAEDLQLKAITKDLDEAGIQRYSEIDIVSGRRHFLLTGGMRGMTLAAADLQALIGAAEASTIGMGFSLQGAYRFNMRWTVGLNFAAPSVGEQKDEASYTLAMSGLGLFVEWNILHEMPYRVSLSVGADMLSVTANGQDALGERFTAETASSMLSFPAKLVFNWYPWENIAVVIGAGYQYVASSAELAVDTGGTAEINAAAPFAEAGLQVEF